MSDVTRREFVETTAAVAAAGALLGSGSAAAAQSPAFMSAVQLAELVRGKQIGAEELARYFIDRIERYDGKLNAVVVRDFERGLEAARAADSVLSRGEILGPLHGVPITVKESYDVAGLPSTWGIPEAAGNIAAVDAVVVERLKHAGAVVLGKTNVPINLGDYQSYNAIYGTTNNPWDVTRTPGGSSGGSAAALAAGLTGLEAGSDIGGSIRNPAHYCGVYGHKPTHGVIPGRGQQPPGVPPSPQSPDLAVVGPLARSAEDLAQALEVVAGPDYLMAPGWRLELPAPRMQGFKGLRVALWADDPRAPVSTEIVDRVQQVGDRLASLGAVVSDTARPAFPASLSHETYLPLLGGMTEGPEAQLKYVDWMALHGQRGYLRVQWQQFFRDWDILLCPIASVPAFPQDQSEMTSRTLDINGEQRSYFEQLFWAGLATVSYLPSTVFPTGLSAGGLPIGLQAMGAEFADRTTIEFARLAAQEFGGFQPPPGYQS